MSQQGLEHRQRRIGGRPSWSPREPAPELSRSDTTSQTRKPSDDSTPCGICASHKLKLPRPSNRTSHPLQNRCNPRNPHHRICNGPTRDRCIMRCLRGWEIVRRALSSGLCFGRVFGRLGWLWVFLGAVRPRSGERQRDPAAHVERDCRDEDLGVGLDETPVTDHAKPHAPLQRCEGRLDGCAAAGNQLLSLASFGGRSRWCLLARRISRGLIPRCLRTRSRAWV